MGKVTGITWTSHTFSIAWGCFKVSAGCRACYAETLAKRYGFDVWGPPGTTPRRTFGEKHWAEPLRWERAAAKAGERRRVFCSSMADVFEDHPTIDEEREKLWPLIRATPNLDWQLLTKRPERILDHLPGDWGDGYPNTWIGTSVEDQETADLRLPFLQHVPAVVRFISAEPLLGPVRLGAYLEKVSGINPEECRDPAEVRRIMNLAGLALFQFVIVGGESGSKARPMDLAWARQIVADCSKASVKCFVKQLGAHPHENRHGRIYCFSRRSRIPECGAASWSSHLAIQDSHGGDMSEFPADLRVRDFPAPLLATEERE